MSDKPTIMVADMCQTHQVLLVRQADYRESDPWRALVVVCQIALFQAATCDPETHKRIGGDIGKIGSLGCLACYKPDAFGEVVEAAKSHDLGRIKALGERWVKENAVPSENGSGGT
jgi:hypothetical protein